MVGLLKWIIILICLCICFPSVYKALDGLTSGGRKKDEKNKRKNNKKSSKADSSKMGKEELLREINKLEERIDNLNEILRERNNG